MASASAPTPPEQALCLPIHLSARSKCSCGLGRDSQALLDASSSAYLVRCPAAFLSRSRAQPQTVAWPDV